MSPSSGLPVNILFQLLNVYSELQTIDDFFILSHDFYSSCKPLVEGGFLHGSEGENSCLQKIQKPAGRETIHKVTKCISEPGKVSPSCSLCIPGILKDSQGPVFQQGNGMDVPHPAKGPHQCTHVLSYCFSLGPPSNPDPLPGAPNPLEQLGFAACAWEMWQDSQQGRCWLQQDLPRRAGERRKREAPQQAPHWV